MSWLGGLNDSFNQLTSITGQIGGQLSNFTKEVLTETAEDNIDYEVEAKRLGQELKKYEALTSNLKHENEALKEKIHAAELHISTSGIEFEAKLQDKTKEIVQLKQKLSNHGDHSIVGAPILSSSFSNVSLQDDDEDFHDVINYQREINRLSRELDGVRHEMEFWKEKANSTQNMESNQAKERNTDASFGAKVKELENALRRESDHHQQEMRSMQDAHAATISRYQEEIRKFKLARSDSPVAGSPVPDAATNETVLLLCQEKEKLLSEQNSLNEQMRTRNRQLQVQKKQLEDLNAGLKKREKELLDVKESKTSLVNELEKLKSAMSLLESENEITARKLSEISQEISRLLSGEDIPVRFDEQNVPKCLVEFFHHFHRIVEEKAAVSVENAQFRTEIERLQNRVDELEEIADNGAENEVGNDVQQLGDTELAESDQWHQEGENQAAEEDQNIEYEQYQRRYLPPHLDFGSPLRHSSPQVSSARRRLADDSPQPVTPQNPGDLTLTLQALQKQVEDYELEIEEYEKVQSEWQVEKKSLQELLNRYQNEVGQLDGQTPYKPEQPIDERAATVERLKQELDDLKEARGALEKETNRLMQEKEQLQVATKNLEEELNSSIMETQKEKDQTDALKTQLEKFDHEKEKLQAAYDILTQELNKSREEKDDLDQALDALDMQHQDEMAQLLSVRDELKEQLRSTQKHLKQETEAKDNLQKEIDVLKDDLRNKELNSDDASHTMDEKIRDLQQEKETLKSKLEDSEKTVEKLKCENQENWKLIENIRREKSVLDKKIVQLENDIRTEDGYISETEQKFSKLQKNHEDFVKDLNQRHEEEVRIKEHEFQTLFDDKNSQIERLESLLRAKEEDSVQKNTEEILVKIQSLENSLTEKDSLSEKLKLEKERLEEKYAAEVVRLQDEIDVLGNELENAGKEMAETQAAHEESVKKMQKDHQDTINKTRSDSDATIKKLDAKFNDFKNEANATNKVYQEKIAHLEKINLDLQKKVEDVRTEDGKKLSEMSVENETLISNLRQQYSNLTEQYNALLEQHTVLKNSIENEKNLLENRLKMESEQKIASQKECAELKNLLQKARDAETSLSTEISALRIELEESRHKIAELSQKLTEKEIFSPEKEVEYDKKVSSLMAEIENLKKQLSSTVKPLRSDISVEEMLNDLKKHDLAGLEKSDLSKDDIGSLLQLIKERDNVIEVLRQKQSSSVQTPVDSYAEIRRLEDTNRSLAAEKDQILAVISEKTRENRKLKDEAHKMMDIVAESRAALEKVQQENAALLAKYEGYDKEMTKEAVTKLSRLVREKELEIESLQQKCGTLLEVLQQQGGGGNAPAESMVSGEQVQNLLRDKETLTAQVQQLLNERNHLVALLNQRQVEVEEARTEVSKAAEALERDATDNSRLQIDYGNMVHDYDQTQIKLATVQKELANLREKSAQLENMKTSLLAKFESLNDSQPKVVMETTQNSHSSPLGGSQVNSAEFENLKEKFDHVSETLAQKETLLRQLNDENSRRDVEIEMLQKDSKEKDILIHARTDEMNRSKKDLAAKTNEVEILRKSVENLREQVAGLSKNCDEARKDVRDSSTRLQEKEAESQAFQETNAQLSMLLKEKEYELENAREKCQRLEAMARQSQEGKDTESQKLMVELDNSKQALIAARHERDQVMLSLKQKKIEGDKYAEEAKTLREKEVKLESELARLRNHLIQVEEAYTQEAVLAGDREASLKEQLEQTRSTHNAAREATELSQQQAESLQEQLRTALAQRDQAIQQMQLSQEQGMHYATALQKLQVAVERMQREEAANFAEQLEKVKGQLEIKTADANAFEAMANDLKVKLENANEALKSASRLNNQLELKEENINQLKNIVAEKQLQLDDLTDKLHHVTTKNEGMVDKEIMKNLVIGYFTSPNNKRVDVLRLITGILGFSQEEAQRVNAGGSQGGARGWIGGWLWRGGDNGSRPSMSVPASPRGGAHSSNESFTQMFVKFLESESKPHQAAKLPTAAMISEAQQKRRPPLSPGISSVPTPVGFTAAERARPTVAGRYSPYLLSSANATSTPKNVQGSHPPSGAHPVALHPITPVLPTFSPIINPKPSAEQEILKDILLSGSDR